MHGWCSTYRNFLDSLFLFYRWERKIKGLPSKSHTPSSGFFPPHEATWHSSLEMGTSVSWCWKSRSRDEVKTHPGFGGLSFHVLQWMKYTKCCTDFAFPSTWPVVSFIPISCQLTKASLCLVGTPSLLPRLEASSLASCSTPSIATHTYKVQTFRTNVWEDACSQRWMVSGVRE